ncbi:T9SS type A sorting domain-containing protein [Chitinophaga oryziterrae]|uniref:T9SS type A sorting domain-containing protein n=1 Tax=Chitinophaga oryziterrae TaxID=1031224 RepID=A0A6N8JD63_9BACT|nr:T9SS type A sorting domain-containing protein [Chitinophaga oryziterrae]MVT42052.1 T9SS type A sorting domain-containing protein [Chitinophaga oryziterrae]
MRKARFLLMALLCHAHLFAQTQCAVVGWASQNGGVTGGGTATATVVTNYNDLKTAITSSSVKVVHISGTITIPSAGRISLQDQSGKTIYGLPGSKLVSTDQTKDGSGILYVKRCSNIIFRNVTLEGPGAYDTDGWDNMTLDNSTNIWIDHCEYQDGMDGNLDIKNMADYITVTWCKFIYLKAPRAGGPGGSDDHRFSDLFGSSDGATGDRGHLRVTMQHCWWAQGCKERMPRVRFGKVHMVNNFFNSTVASKCVTAGFEADLLVESNVFENVNNAITTMDNTFTAVTSRNNIFTNTSGDTTNSGAAFTPPYTLTITSAANVKSLVTAGAGATLTSPYCDSTTTPAPVTYTLSTIAAPTTGGTITGGGTYDSATVVTVKATAATGYTFTGWSGAISDTSTVVSVTMNSDKSVTANFQAQNTADSTTTDTTGITDTTIRIEDDASTSQGLCSYDGAISSNSGAANGKVINLANAADKGVSWKINVPEAGTYAINWRYVNSSSSNTYTMALIINGVTVNSAQSFPKTSGSTVFANATASVSLNAGDNTIRLQSVAATATADIDWMEVTGKTPSAASCVSTMASYVLPASEIAASTPAIYPNPTTGVATITMTLQKNEQAVIRVYNTQGSLVDNLGTIRSETGGTQQIHCNLNGKKPGLYYVVVTGDKGFKSGYKLFVE